MVETFQSCNSQQTNKNQTGRNNSLCEISINPFADPSNEIIVSSEQQRPLQGTIGGFLFVADKNGINGFRKAAVVSTQQANDQKGMGMMGVVSAAAMGLSTMGIGMSSFSVMATQSQAAFASIRDTQQSACILPQTGRHSSCAPLPLSNVPTAMTVSSFPRGVRWDGDGCSGQITLIDNLTSHDGTQRREANQSQNSSNNGTGNERQHSRSNSTETSFSIMKKRSGLGADAMERDMLCANLRALFSAPVVDPSVYTVVEELPPFELNQLLLHLCLFDPPIITRAFLPEDSLLVVIDMARRCVLRMASAASSDGKVASVGMSAAAVVSFVQALSEILEGVAVGGMNVAHGSEPKACSSASQLISKAAFNRDENEDGDTLLGDKVPSDDGRLSVPARARSSLSPPPPPQLPSLSSSVNQLA
ncbi:uncharacterized protein MONOS_7863 [Monocercomonoides exilis]|uniref:uncharacterized protein n=1 Tax=Monocercomonoides exilis TaxID=2049356 RepID=UPI00355A334F|nr:hypothetical protein MONOS_7863 [Monocercomonoides exilis]|eukprot:MONOS_7863.1-p1 / transcript=MONOS_7863.1 / gene=MONOS_7863 / organism=Monocercomonoides_exilis_PA203 / gene_product=unspecified product / transcript_product=unspecified product / location=Mono_scaffold00280:62601-64408(+) / protein_length=419 / sequence_SO=supercontig / SO=protein_coding / is_pseudo=false